MNFIFGAMRLMGKEEATRWIRLAMTTLWSTAMCSSRTQVAEEECDIMDVDMLERNQKVNFKCPRCQAKRMQEPMLRGVLATRLAHELCRSLSRAHVRSEKFIVSVTILSSLGAGTVY